MRKPAAALAVVVLIPVLVVAASGKGAERGLAAGCSFAPATGILSIEDEADSISTVVRRAGDRIVVTDVFGFDQSCAGPIPTVTNTDRIEVDVSSFITTFSIDLTGGRFAPGRTDEGDGSSEIEIDAKLGVEPIIEIAGGQRREKMTLGRVADSTGAINLNADERVADADLVFRARNEQIQADMGGGRDRFSASTSSGFVRPYRTLYFFHGGNGRDTLIGGPGKDGLEGGRDPDRLRGLQGRDALYADRGGKDRVDCGPGRDYARVDGQDRVRGCERAD